MDPTKQAAIEFTIDKYKLRENHDTAGNLIDALQSDGEKMTAQHLQEAMTRNDYLSRSTLINNFLRDIEPMSSPLPSEGLSQDFVSVKTKNGIIIPNSPSSVEFQCNHYDGIYICGERASVLMITDTEPAIAFALCTTHQRGDLTKIPMDRAIALPWEDETPEKET